MAAAATTSSCTTATWRPTSPWASASSSQSATAARDPRPSTWSPSDGIAAIGSGGALVVGQRCARSAGVAVVDDDQRPADFLTGVRFARVAAPDDRFAAGLTAAARALGVRLVAAVLLAAV